MRERLIYNCKQCCKVVYTEYKADTESGLCRACIPAKGDSYRVWDTANPPIHIKARSPKEAAERYMLRGFNSRSSSPGKYVNDYICVETKRPATGRDKQFNKNKVVVFKAALEVRSVAAVTLQKIKGGN